MEPTSPQPVKATRWLRASVVLSFLFGGVTIIGILSALRGGLHQVDARLIGRWELAFAAVIAAAIGLSLWKKFRSRLFWEIIFTLTVFLGVWYAALLVLPLEWGFLIAALLTLGELFLQRVWIHNLLYLVGCVGVAIDFASWLNPDILLVGLVGLTIYDMVAGPPGGPVERLAGMLVGRGLVPGLVLPARPRDLFVPLKEVIHGSSAMLGAGDLIVPLALVARAAFSGMVPAGIVLLGLIVGAIFLAKSSDLHPRAALPALAAGVAVPFLVLRFLSMV